MNRIQEKPEPREGEYWLLMVGEEAHDFAHPSHHGWAAYLNRVDRQLNPYDRVAEFVDTLPPEHRERLHNAPLESLIRFAEQPRAQWAAAARKQMECIVEIVRFYAHGLHLANPGMTVEQCSAIIGNLPIRVAKAIVTLRCVYDGGGCTSWPLTEPPLELFFFDREDS